MPGKIKEKPHIKMAEYDQKLREEYGPILVGCDEVGRGSWAFAIAAGAVILPEDAHLPGLNDSKLMSFDMREKLFDDIIAIALAWSVSYVEAPQIDDKGLTWANRQVMMKASAECRDFIEEPVDLYVVDQSTGYPWKPVKMLPKADSTSLSVAAASVIAKVSRDRLVIEMSSKYPEYKFDITKGYVRPEHIEAVNKYGLIEGIHRMSYNVKGCTVKKYIKEKNSGLLNALNEFQND